MSRGQAETLIIITSYHFSRYFGEEAMLAYVKEVQRKEIRAGLDCVKHQDMAGTYIGDDHKEYFSGQAALKAGGKDNTMNQFEDVTVKKTKMSALNGHGHVRQGAK